MKTTEEQEKLEVKESLKDEEIKAEEGKKAVEKDFLQQNESL